MLRESAIQSYHILLQWIYSEIFYLKCKSFQPRINLHSCTKRRLWKFFFSKMIMSLYILICFVSTQKKVLPKTSDFEKKIESIELHNSRLILKIYIPDFHIRNKISKNRIWNMNANLNQILTKLKCRANMKFIEMHFQPTTENQIIITTFN